MDDCSTSKTLCDTGGDLDELSSRTALRDVESGAEHVVQLKAGVHGLRGLLLSAKGDIDGRDAVHVEQCRSDRQDQVLNAGHNELPAPPGLARDATETPGHSSC